MEFEIFFEGKIRTEAENEDEAVGKAYKKLASIEAEVRISGAEEV